MIFSVFQKNLVFGYSWSTLLWYWCYYPHQSRDAVSPVCGIFFISLSPPFERALQICQFIMQSNLTVHSRRQGSIKSSSSKINVCLSLSWNGKPMSHYRTLSNTWENMFVISFELRLIPRAKKKKQAMILLSSSSSCSLPPVTPTDVAKLDGTAAAEVNGSFSLWANFHHCLPHIHCNSSLFLWDFALPWSLQRLQWMETCIHTLSFSAPHWHHGEKANISTGCWGRIHYLGICKVILHLCTD